MGIEHLAAHFRCRSGLFVAMMFVTACADKAPSVTLSAEEQLMLTGSQKARMCAGCHGPKGISRVASYPSIAGLPEAYITEQLQAFRTGQRQNPMMGSVAQNLSVEDVRALSFYYSNLPAPLASREAGHKNPAAGNQTVNNQTVNNKF